MTTRNKALMLINEMAEFQRAGNLPILDELSLQHDITKLSAQYLCVIVQYEFPEGSEKHEYWKQVKQEIENL